MSAAQDPPGYSLEERLALTRPEQVKALSHPLRNTVLQLLHEREVARPPVGGPVEVVAQRVPGELPAHSDVLAHVAFLFVTYLKDALHPTFGAAAAIVVGTLLVRFVLLPVVGVLVWVVALLVRVL